MTVNARVAALRQQMQQHHINAYLVPSSDPHQSEYVAAHWKAREWLSGFTGSAATVVVTPENAVVWTDGRYFLQAETELAHTDWQLGKLAAVGGSDYENVLADALPPDSTIACDGQLFSAADIARLKRIFQQKGHTFIADLDLIAPIWLDRPALPNDAIFEHPVAFAGQSRAEKLTIIRAQMQAAGATHHLVTTLDDIAWTLNIRGNDVEANPVAIAHLLIGLEETLLFINVEKVSHDLRTALAADNVFLQSYDEITHHLAKMSAAAIILLDPTAVNEVLANAATSSANIVNGTTISMPLKAVKNDIEQAHIRTTMAKDGVALLRAIRWLFATLPQRPVSEYEMGSMIAQYRSQEAHYFGESFNAIVGYNGNGAIIHYRAPLEGSAMIQHNEGILLLDSGGQYADGTTDITRTIAIGKPTAEQKRDFTLVLKGHIAIARLQFLSGTRGVQMDVLARQFLWQYGLNYNHGTGHGVGFFLNVHEPPQGIIQGLGLRGKTEMRAGMLTSNEPGFYKTGEYGIRIENLVLSQPSVETNYGAFLHFETVTLFPIDATLIDIDLLDTAERDWLNAYHYRVQTTLAPLLNAEENAWLAMQCAKI